jgi:RNA polymerase primary sigma factor
MYGTPNDLETERKNDETIKLLLDHGRRQGYLTWSDILDCVPDAEFDEELREQLFEAIKDARIPYVKEDESAAKIVDDFSEVQGVEELGELDIEPESADLNEVATDDMLKLYIKEASQVPLLTGEQEIEIARRIEQGRNAQQELTKHNGKTKGRDDLLAQVEQGRQARDRLIRANVRLVISVARKYLGRGMPFLDLIQEGNIGLMRAIRNYDYHRGFKFSTYATWWIRQAVTRALAEQSRTIRLPVHMSDQVGRMIREQNRLSQVFGRNPTNQELAEALGTTPDHVDQMKDVVRQPISLQTPVGEDEDEVLGDFVEDTQAGNPEETVSELLANEELMKMLEKLPNRELEVLRLRYGLGPQEPLTLNEVGRRLGITRERVRQLEIQAIERLRNPDGQRRKRRSEG